MPDGTSPTAETRPLRILRMPEVEHKVGLKKTQIYELISQNEFPRGIKLSKQATGWLEHEVEAFLLKRIAASRPELPAREIPES